jgi:hypothetical protein
MTTLIRNVFALASNAKPNSPLLFAICLGGVLSGCGDAGDVPATVVTTGPGGPGAEAAGPDGQALGDANGLVPEEQVTVAGTCAAEIAAETFASALCSCEDTNIAGYLRTRGFRASDGPNAPELLAGNVGVNRDYITAGYADIGGSFAVAGERDVAFGGFLNSGEDLRFNPAFDVAGVVDVARDAFLAGSVRAFGRVGIGRDLHMAAGAGFRGIALVDVGGEEHTEAVTVEPPCPCGPGQIIDVPALVAAAETDNDNDSVGLGPNDFNLVVGIGAEVTLPTGRFYINQIGGVGAITMHVTGKAALFVADDLLATGLFRVELEPDAEIDIFVRDNLVITGAAVFGDSARPSATRVYVGGTGDVAIAGAAAFSGNLYAPRANVLIGGFGRIDGSLFGKNINAAGFLSVGYDASVGDGGEGCPPVEDGEIPRIR